MHRIDTATVDEDEHGSGKDGFTGGDPGAGISPTDLSADWCDAVQEELAGVVEDQGLGLDKTNHYQVVAAIKSLLREHGLLNWTPISFSTAVPFWRAVAYDPNLHVYVAVSASGTEDLAWSHDGKSWTHKDVSGGLFDVAARGSKMMVIDSATIYESIDGKSWSGILGGAAEALAAIGYVASSSRWYACGQNGYLLESSDDGGTWSQVTTGTTKNLNAIATGSGRAVIAGDGGVALVSTDGGVNWSTVATPAGTDAKLTDVAYSDRHKAFYISYNDSVANRGGVMRADESDVTSWTVQHEENTGGDASAWDSLACDGGAHLVATANRSPFTLVRSKDEGATWWVIEGTGVAGTALSDLDGVDFAGGVFFAFETTGAGMARTLRGV